ncbi:uncharacterized protein LOC116305562 [Actinia tenebrosa]|uniref:Uncharacterized protein LOC116305562 n=1 Tax=Actinia tenebrosa TaxID=6105 RepID=A0A6P8IVP8_ACTTE|nr:uncharacterized protein LOC116305562 [Actinia tenebrosa]
MATNAVKLYIYELSNGLARQMSPLLLGKQIDGIWHTGVVCFGHEFFFGGGGIEYCRPGGTILGQPDEVINLGDTHIPEDVFMEYLRGLGADAFRADKYHLFEHNCNKFSNEVTMFLTGRKIPKHIHDLPNDILNSAFGQMIKPIVDSMRVTPAGGSTVDDSGHVSSSSSSHPRPNPSSKAKESSNPESIFEPRSDQHQPSTNHESLPVPVVHNVEDVTKILEALQSDLGEDRTELESCLDDIESLLLKKKEVVISEEFVSSIEKLFSKMKEVKDKPRFLLNFLGVMKGLCLEKSYLEHPKAQDILYKLISELSVCPSKQSQIILVPSLQMLCNAVSIKPGHDLLLSNTASQPHMLSVLTNCLLEGENDVQLAASELTFNVARHKVSSDIAFECSTAVMELLTREPDKTITYYCLFALHRFMQYNSEIPGLAKALEVDVTKYKGQSDEVDSLCQQLTVLMT